MSVSECPVLRITARPNGLGAEIGGVDLAKVPRPEVSSAIKAALARHGVIWFPNQPLVPQELEALTAALGDFGAEPYLTALPDLPRVVEVRREPDEKVVVFGGGWHSDWSFLERPPAATLLQAKILPPRGGDTLFADGAMAYEALPEARRSALTGLMALHSAAGPYGPEGYFARETGRTGMNILTGPEATAVMAHPLVRTHPVTGRCSLFVSPGYTVGIEGLTQQEAASVLEPLYEHMTQQRFVLRLRWRPDMLTIWDNRLVMHQATGGYDGHRRVMHRTTIAGERPFFAPL